MLTGWQYRIASVGGSLGLTILAVLVANHPFPQALITTYVPLFNNLEPEILTGGSLTLAIMMSCLAVFAFSIPLFKPRPRRILDTVFLTQQRVFVAGLALATLGYFKWSHRLPRQTLVLAMGTLAIMLPLWFVWIRRRPQAEPERAIVVGDDLGLIETIVRTSDLPIVGYLCPTSVFTPSANGSEQIALATDGGIPTHSRLGGLSRLEDVLVERDIDTVVLAFRSADRAEFFGALDACHDHGVAAKVHREHADSVLTPPGSVEPIVDVEIEPWDPQDYFFKRVFDVAFSLVGLIGLSPIVVAIAIAIKLDSQGPVFYEQNRTAVFGETFRVKKFRSMVTDAEAETGVTISNEDAGGIDPRVTRVGRVLRKTHMDEIPQLWSVLKGDMSVVGPRPERPEIDNDIQSSGIEWEKRWFVKPGLTGLAQINDVTGHEPNQKLHLDLQYVRQQSLTFDIAIVVRQIWKVISDSATFVAGSKR